MNINLSHLNQIKDNGNAISTDNISDISENRNTVKNRRLEQTGQAAAVFSGSENKEEQIYSDKGRSQNEIASIADDMDVDLNRNYEVLMSNTMSEEDYEQARKDGYDPRDMDADTAVTILDKIKAVLVESGTNISGFTDDLSEEQLAKITGSQSYANELIQNFQKKDVPATTDNVEAVQGALACAKEINKPSENVCAYMIENKMDPTVNNLYLASHSVNGQTSSGSGFYTQETDGYLARKADTVNWEQLMPQMKQVIREAGYDTEDAAALDQAKSLIQNDIPLTSENLKRGMDIQSVSFPLSAETVIQAGVSAIADGKKAADGNLTDTRSLLQQAVDIKNDTNKVTDQAIKDSLQRSEKVNLKNLISAQRATENNRISSDINETQTETKESAQIEESDSENNQDQLSDTSDVNVINARKQLEEVKLVMSVQTNLKLLKSGYQIDTAPMEELIAKLSEAADALQTNMFSQNSEEMSSSSSSVKITTAIQKSEKYEETIGKISFMPSVPAAIVGALKDEFKVDTLDEIYNKALELKLNRDKAGESYEALMTKPRTDLGDRIDKAFQNVNDILQDLGEEPTKENQRAVRILGYNQMSITTENIEQVSAWDSKLTTTIDRLKPAAVLQMIRDGQNPLTMTLDELNQNLDNRNSQSQNQDEKYEKFLYKLEKRSDITSEEKESYIGIYRLFNSLQKTDDAAIGMVLNTGAEMTVGNLLAANRTLKASVGGLDYTVDDSFGGIEQKESETPTISAQIESAFTFYSAKADSVYENIEPEKLKNYGASSGTELTELADAMETMDTDQTLESDWRNTQLNEIRKILADDQKQEACQELKEDNIPFSVNHLEAMQAIQASRKSNDKTIWDKVKEADSEGETEVDEIIQNMTSALTESDDYTDTYKTDLTSMTDCLNEIISDTDVTYIDMKAISLLHKQLTIAQEMADKGSFEIPVQVGEHTVSMHVVLQQDETSGSKVEASLDTQEYGNITTALQVKDGTVSGIMTVENGATPQTKNYCEQVKTRLASNIAQLTGLNFQKDNMAVIYGSRTNRTFAGSDTKISDRVLFNLAQAFVTAI